MPPAGGGPLASPTNLATPSSTRGSQGGGAAAAATPAAPRPDDAQPKKGCMRRMLRLRTQGGSAADLAVVQYHYSLRLVCLGALVGSVARFSKKGEDGNHHLHNPNSGAMWVLGLSLTGAIISVLIVWTDVLRKPADVKAAQLLANKTQRALDYTAPFFFCFGFFAGLSGTHDIGWAVADGCSCLALVFAVWGIWAFVEALEACMSGGQPAKKKTTVTVETARQQRASLAIHRFAPVQRGSLSQKKPPSNPLDFSSVLQ